MDYELRRARAIRRCFVWPVLTYLMALTSLSAGCSAVASQTQSAQTEQQMSALFPGFRAELLRFDGKSAWGVAKIQVCGPFGEFVDQSGVRALFEPALDNASRASSDGSVYTQPFNHFVLQWHASDDSVTPAPIGEHACEATRGQPCLPRATPLGNQALIDGVPYVHNFADYLKQHPQVAQLLGKPVGMALRYNERNAVRHFFENGALEYNGQSQHVGLVPLGAQVWRQAGAPRSPLPGLCIVDDQGRRQGDYSVHAWSSPNEPLSGGSLIGFGTPIGPTPTWTSSVCSSLAAALVCGLAIVVVVAIVGVPVIARLIPDAGARGRHETAALSSQAVLTSTLMGMHAGAGSAFAMMLTPASTISLTEAPPAVLLSNKRLGFGEPFPPHFIPGAEGRPGPEIRRGILGGILTKAGMDMDAGVGIVDVLSELQQREAELRHSAGLMNNGMTDWLAERQEMTDDELAELAEPLGKSAEELRRWLDEALQWTAEEARQLEEAAEAYGDAQERIEDASSAAAAIRDVAVKGGDPSSAIDMTAEQLVANVSGLSLEQQAAAVAAYEREIRSSAGAGVIGEQEEHMALEAARRARERLGLPPP